MLQFLEGFIWFDQRLQQHLQDAGMPSVNRTESMIMLYSSAGVVRPGELGNRIGLARQSVNSAIRSLEAKGLVRLGVDPSDARCRIIEHTDEAQPVYDAALQAITDAEDELAGAIGRKRMAALQATMALMIRPR